MADQQQFSATAIRNAFNAMRDALRGGLDNDEFFSTLSSSDDAKHEVGALAENSFEDQTGQSYNPKRMTEGLLAAHDAMHADCHQDGEGCLHGEQPPEEYDEEFRECLREQGMSDLEVEVVVAGMTSSAGIASTMGPFAQMVDPLILTVVVTDEIMRALLVGVKLAQSADTSSIEAEFSAMLDSLPTTDDADGLPDKPPASWDPDEANRSRDEAREALMRYRRLMGFEQTEPGEEEC